MYASPAEPVLAGVLPAPKSRRKRLFADIGRKTGVAMLYRRPFHYPTCTYHRRCRFLPTMSVLAGVLPAPTSRQSRLSADFNRGNTDAIMLYRRPFLYSTCTCHQLRRFLPACCRPPTGEVDFLPILVEENGRRHFVPSTVSLTGV